MIGKLFLDVFASSSNQPDVEQHLMMAFCGLSALGK
jgi:hypothetical protein